MTATSVVKELKLSLTLTDARAIEIAYAIPEDRRSEVLEKYIVLGEMVVSHASIATRKETVEDFFTPLKSDIDMIRAQLQRIVPTLSTPATKGEVTVETIFRSLQEHFMDDSFEDVSRIGKYADILATISETKTPILIELKDYKGTVPTEEVEKFWRDLERRGVRYGVFVSMRSGIAKLSSCINIKTEMNRTAVFVVDSDLNWSGHLFAYHVVRMMNGLLSAGKADLKGEELQKALARVEGHVRELQKIIEPIDSLQRIADGLRTTCKNKLGELIDVSNRIKSNLNDRINDILGEMKEAGM